MAEQNKYFLKLCYTNRSVTNEMIMKLRKVINDQRFCECREKMCMPSSREIPWPSVSQLSSSMWGSILFLNLFIESHAN